MRNTTKPGRAAFYGRTARAQDCEHTNDHLARQYLTCARSLPTGLTITATFYDIGPTNWLHPHPPDTITVESTTLRRDGGLRELLTDARDPRRRRFDFVIITGLDRIRRSQTDCLTVLTHLYQLGVHTLVACNPSHDQIAHTIHPATAMPALPPWSSEATNDGGSPWRDRASAAGSE